MDERQTYCCSQERPVSLKGFHGVYIFQEKKKKNLPTEDTQEQQTVPHLQVHSIICYTDVHNN